MKTESENPGQGAEGRQEGASVSYLDQALWRQLGTAESIEDFSRAWIVLQCAMINGAEQGLVVRKDEDQFRPVAVYPEDTTRSPHLQRAAELALRERRGVVHRPDGDASSRAAIAYPVIIDDEVQSIAAVELEPRSDVQLRSVMRQLQWGSSWFEAFYRRNLPAAIEARNENLATVVKLVTASLEMEGFTPSVTSLATELATNLGCERVSIGFVENRHHRVRAISHSANFDKRSNLVREIGHAMDEASEQLEPVSFPREDGSRFQVNKVHERLQNMAGVGSVTTVLIANNDDIMGAMTFEHSDAGFFTADRVRLLTQIALLVGPILDLKRRDDRSLPRKVVDSCSRFFGNVVGPDYLLAKTIVGAIVLTIAALAVIAGEHRVSADATLEGSVQRHMSAPVDGYIAASFARAGDIVSAGDPLFALDDKDMNLERLKWASEELQTGQKYRDALARRDKAEASIQKAQLDQARIQIQLIDSELARIRAVAPFDGVVVSGDLSQKLGAPVQKGDTLLKVAPLDSYRIILEVGDMDIARVSEGQTGQLSLSSLPGDTFRFVVDKVTPESTPGEGRNVFRVEAQLLEKTDKLRPGMEGTGKILIGERSQLWIWTHGFFDWFRVWWWSISP